MITPSIDLALIPLDYRGEWEHFRGYGWDDRRIATRLGLDPETPEKWASRNALRVEATAIAQRRAKVAELSTQGWSNRQIARMLGVSPPTVDEDVKVLRAKAVA